MSNEVVPYSQMEKMAVTVAKSGLFGMKTSEQALALMALAQAEGIHPMTAVRDYHIIQGRPSIKAETMLARFLAAGGKVEWHSYTDALADATFTHPTGGTVRVDWTMERAKTAGLTSKDVWKSYGRAMLRSRVISEGIRTVCPGVVQGVYSPEELESLAPDAAVPQTQEAAIESFEHPGMPESELNAHFEAFDSAINVSALQAAFAVAWASAKASGDERRQASLKLAYDARKAELQEAKLPQEQI